MDTLVIKCRRALQQEQLKTLVMAGGVSANRNLAHPPSPSASAAACFTRRRMFCTDNGAMIAYAGAQRLLAGEHDDSETRVRPRWPMDELGAPGAVR